MLLGSYNDYLVIKVVPIVHLRYVMYVFDAVWYCLRYCCRLFNCDKFMLMICSVCVSNCFMITYLLLCIAAHTECKSNTWVICLYGLFRNSVSFLLVCCLYHADTYSLIFSYLLLQNNIPTNI